MRKGAVLNVGTALKLEKRKPKMENAEEALASLQEVNSHTRHHGCLCLGGRIDRSIKLVGSIHKSSYIPILSVYVCVHLCI